MCLTLRRDIQAVVLQQSKDQPNQFSGSESECAFVLVLVDLFEFEVIVSPELGVASSHRVGGFQQVVNPFVMGRKYWLFANTPAGAQASAVIYSLMETAKET